jgi:pseudouridine 5'-phosphatase
MANEAQLPVNAVIFDMDGLLLDTEGFYTEVTQIIVGRFGKTFDWSYKQNTIGLGAVALATYITEAMDLPMTPDEFLEEREPLLRARFVHAPAMPGARELVRHLARHRVPMAVATSSRRDYFSLKTHRHADWFSCFAAIVTADDPEVGAAKPAPDLFKVAAQRIGADPARTLAFEDSPFGVQAAVAAGMRVIAVPDPAMDRARYSSATQILGGLPEFQPGRWGLPAMDR